MVACQRQQREAAAIARPAPRLARLGGAQCTACPERGSLSAFQICRMITSVSEFTALIPPTCGLTHVAVTSLPGYWYEEGRRRGGSRCSQRTLLPAQTEPRTPGESWRQRGHRGLPPAQGSCGKQHRSQVKLLPYFSFVCYTGKSLSRQDLRAAGEFSVRLGCAKHPAVGHPGQSTEHCSLDPCTVSILLCLEQAQFGDFC